MKILAISINDNATQTVSYEDDKGRKQSRVTPIIEEDGLLLQWMKDNPVVEPEPVKKQSTQFFKGPKG